MDLPRAPLRPVTAEERADYARDGAVVLRAVLPDPWIRLMQTAVDRALASPSGAFTTFTQPGDPGRYAGDFQVWLRDPDIRAFVLDSPLVDVAQQLIGASQLNVFYDQLLVKEPGTRDETPWHQDLPYWPVKGEQVVSFWTPFDSVPAEAGALRYIKGSHLHGTMYAPRAFGKNTGFAELFAKMGLPPFPSDEEILRGADLLVCACEPGDVVVHHPLTMHWSPGNLHPVNRRRALSVRYMGDDIVFDDRPGTFVEMPKVANLFPEPIRYRAGERLGGRNFPQVWPRA